MTKRIELLAPARDAETAIGAITCGADAIYMGAERFGAREAAAESGLDMSGRMVMTTKYCLRQELGLCGGRGPKSNAKPMILQDEDGREYRILFCCGLCGMEIFFGRSASAHKVL